MSKKQIPIGFDMLYYAIMTDETNETYGVPKRLPGAISLNVAPSVNVTNLPGDDITYDTTTSQGPTTVSMGVAEIPVEDRAALLGHSIVDGGLVEKTSDVAPYVALMFRRKLANSKYRYVVLYKGRFQPSTEDIQTKGETVSYQTPVLQATFIERQTDALWRYTTTDGDAGVTSQFLADFFDAVYVPGADTVGPTVSVVPADEATGVAVSANVVWTFDKAIQASLVNGANFMVLDDSLAPVTGALSINDAGTVVTFDPTSNLTNNKTYTAMVNTNIKSLAGVPLAAPSITTFTTVT